MASASITAGKFTYSSSGLLYELEPRCTQAAILKRLLTPDQVNVKWLKAQLAHYMLKPLTGTKDELEARLKGGITAGKVKQQPKDMRDMEKGLKAAWEARGGSKPHAKKVEKVEKVEKKPALKKGAPKGTKKDAALMAALKEANIAAPKPAAAAKNTAKKTTKPEKKGAKAEAKTNSKPGPAPTKAPTVSKPRTAFVDQVLGAYSLTCPVISSPSSSLSLRIFRSVLDPERIHGEIDLGGIVEAVFRLDWVPMAKSSKVPFTWTGRIGDIVLHDNKGEMDFSVAKTGLRVKGRFEGRFEGNVPGLGSEVSWTGTRVRECEDGELDWGQFMDVEGTW